LLCVWLYIIKAQKQGFGVAKKGSGEIAREIFAEHGARVINSVRDHHYEVAHRQALTDPKKAAYMLHVATDTLQVILDLYVANNPKQQQIFQVNEEYIFRRLFNSQALPGIVSSLNGEVRNAFFDKLLQKERDPEKANANRNMLILNAAESGGIVSFSVPYLHGAKIISEAVIAAAFNNHDKLHIPAERLRSLLWVVDTFNEVKGSYYGKDGLLPDAKGNEVVDSKIHTIAALFVDAVNKEVKGIKDFLNHGVTNNKFEKSKAYLSLTVPTQKVKVSNVEAITDVNKGRQV
jgi:hypothetical protein